MRWPPIWIPNPIDWRNYAEALDQIPFFLYVRNTLIVAIGATIGSLISCPFVAYSFARIRWPGRDALFIVSLGTMMLPYHVTMIPIFVIFTRLKWVGTWLPLIIPHFFGSAFFIFLLRQFFLTIPEELADAARIDGASEFGIYFRIILPLAKPVVSVIALFQFMNSWRDFLGPLLYLDKGELYTISLGLQQYVHEHYVDWPLLMAASTLVTLPLVIMFIFTQRTFIEGITFTGLKGV